MVLYTILAFLQCESTVKRPALKGGEEEQGTGGIGAIFLSGLSVRWLSGREKLPPAVFGKPLPR